MNARTAARRSAYTSGVTTVAINDDDRRDEGGTPIRIGYGRRRTTAAGGRGVEGGVGGGRGRRAPPGAARGAERHPPAHPLAPRRIRGAGGRLRGRRQGAAAPAVPPRPPRARGVRGGAARGRG